MADLALECRIWRTRAGYTQKEAAARIGTSQRYLWELENGDRQISIEMLKRMARAYGCRVEIRLLSAEHASTVDMTPA